MGLFNGIKSLKAVNDIRNGKIASLSYGMLVDGLINLPDAQRKLSKEQFSRVYALYKDFKKCTTLFKMDQDTYIFHCKEIIGKFDEIAPYELYSGGNELEFSLMMDGFRKEKQAGADTILKVVTPDTCPIDEEYVGMITDEFNKNNEATLGRLTREEAVEIYRIIREDEFNGKAAAVGRLENFLDEIARDINNNIGDGIGGEGKVLLRKVSLIGFTCGIMIGNNIITENETESLEHKYSELSMEITIKSTNQNKNPDSVINSMTGTSNANSIQNVKANHSQKLHSELSFYKQLVEEGLIDEDDYNSVKKKLLNI